MPEHPALSRALVAMIAVTLCATAACGGSHAKSAARRPGPTSTSTTSPTSRPSPRSTAATTAAPTTRTTPPPTSAPPSTTTSRPALSPGANGLTITRAATGAWVVDIDSKMLRFNLMPGSVEPAGTFIRPTLITAQYRPVVTAAFNGGFKFKDAHGGFFLGGVTAAPLVDGAASLVVFRDGTATVGQWNRDVRMTPDVEAVLQNLHLMVDRGAPTDVSDSDAHNWGSTFPRETVARVPRSGICVTADGQARWVGGPFIGAATLATSMVQAGCWRGMELDINSKWVSFAVYDHPDPANPGVIQGHNIYAGMYFSPDIYFSGKDRNWLMLTMR